jgi:glycosyltransferase involved in cell wall biosynthesis
MVTQLVEWRVCAGKSSVKAMLAAPCSRFVLPSLQGNMSKGRAPMQKLEEAGQSQGAGLAGSLPVSVIVPVRNEAHNLPRCLNSLRGVGEVYIVDSQSSDETTEIAHSFGARVVQFHYRGGWPKKRQWAMDTLPLAHDWVFLVDADEALTPELSDEIRRAIQDPALDGYYVALRMFFLGRMLRHGDAGFYKLSLFRRGKGRFECRLKDQDGSMSDMEVHEHVIVDGKTARLENPLLHYNVESLSRYIQKHNEYSNWDARVWLQGETNAGDLPASLFGSQAQRRRWLRRMLFGVPGSPLLFFIYKYFVRLGFLDGLPGLIYCGFQGVQFFHIKSKIYELRSRKD